MEFIQTIKEGGGIEMTEAQQQQLQPVVVQQQQEMEVERMSDGGSIMQYNIFNNIFQVTTKYKPPILPIGKGACDIVCSAMNSKNEEHAMNSKKIANALDNNIDAKRILQEIKLLRHMDHENVVAIRDIISPSLRNSFNDVYTDFNEGTKLVFDPGILGWIFTFSYQGCPGAFGWCKGMHPLVIHARTKGSKLVKLQWELSEFFDEKEDSLKLLKAKLTKAEILALKESRGAAKATAKGNIGNSGISNCPQKEKRITYVLSDADDRRQDQVMQLMTILQVPMVRVGIHYLQLLHKLLDQGVASQCYNPASRVCPNVYAKCHKKSVYALGMNENGTYLISGETEKVIRVRDPRTGSKTTKLRRHKDNIRTLLLDCTGKLCWALASTPTFSHMFSDGRYKSISVQSKRNEKKERICSIHQ